MARPAGNVDWREANTPAEAIRRAILLPAGKPPEWLREAAASAKAQLLTEDPPEADGAPATTGPGSEPEPRREEFGG
jgi:hypothetical protein